MDSELEKNKTMDGDVGNSRSYGDPVASALNSTNFNIEEEKDNDFKRTSRPKNRLFFSRKRRRAAHHYIKKGKVQSGPNYNTKTKPSSLPHKGGEPDGPINHYQV